MHPVRGTITDIARPDSPRTDVAQYAGKCTVYFNGGMGIKMIRCTRVVVQSGPYAQYNRAVFVQYRETRKRYDRVRVETSHPSVLIVEGHDAPSPDDPFVPVPTASLESGSDDVDEKFSFETVSISRSRYMSCDPRWQSDFDAMVNPKIAAGELKVVYDGRVSNAPESTPA